MPALLHVPGPRARTWLLAALGALALLAALAFYALIQFRSFTPGTVENDCEGYFVLGRRLAHGQPAGMAGQDPFVFQSHVWVVNHRGELLPKYDPGYPLLLGLFGRAGGDEAAFLVSPVFGALAILGCLCLFRLWMHGWLALLATIALVGNPMFEAYASYPLAHAAELAFLSWGCYFLWRWLRRPALGSAVAAGLLLGYAPALRYTAILMAAVVAIAMGAALLRGRRWQREALLPAIVLAGAYAVFPVLLALYHWHWFGSPFVSGYALSGEQDAFAIRYAAANLGELTEGLMREVVWFLFPLAVLGVVCIGSWPERLMRGLWFLGAYAMYGAYYWAPPGMSYHRFLYATLPVLVGGAFLLIDGLQGTRRVRHAAALCVLLVYLLHVLPALAPKGLGGGLHGAVARNQVAAARAIRPHLRPDAVLFLHAPLDTGMGVYQDYQPYRLAAFRSGFIEREMPPWIDPTTPEARRRGGGIHWRIKAQPERRAALAALYEELGADGLSRRKHELISQHLHAGRQVAFLLPAGDNPARRAGVTNVLLTARTTFETPAYGTWTLYIAAARE